MNTQERYQLQAQGFWATKNGEKIHYTKMTYAHRLNILNSYGELLHPSFKKALKASLPISRRIKNTVKKWSK